MVNLDDGKCKVCGILLKCNPIFQKGYLLSRCKDCFYKYKKEKGRGKVWKEMHICKKCGKQKHFSEMTKINEYLLKTCRDCFNKEARDYKRKIGYGITPEQFDRMKELHLNGCAVCKKEGKLHVDHNHKTGKIRGLLCENCNMALGHLYEDEDIIWNLLEYIKQDGFVRDEFFIKEKSFEDYIKE